MKKLHGQFLLPAIVMSAVIASQHVQSAEGGMGVYLLGITGPQAGYLPEPGTYAKYDHYEYEAWTGGSSNLKANITQVLDHPGPGGGQLTVTANIDARLQSRTSITMAADIFTALHVFDTELAGGKPALALIIPYINADLDLAAAADGAADITLSGSRGYTRSFVRSGAHYGEAAFSTENMGDAIASGVIGWHDGSWHYTTGVNVYLPTGEYHESDPVNAGRNYWAIEPNAAFTYLNMQNGREFSAMAGWTFNDENSATDYDTGDELHVEWAAIQHLSKHAYVGLAGYAYQQTSGDSGDGAKLGPFKGQALAVGPVVGATLPLGHAHELVLNMRYYDELDTENRMQGDAMFMTAAVKF
jgi:hypothetical protein